MSNITAAKFAMGYTPAKARLACANCAHAEFRDTIHPTWWCDKGGFLTSPLAICAQHRPLYPTAEQAAA